MHLAVDGTSLCYPMAGIGQYMCGERWVLFKPVRAGDVHLFRRHFAGECQLVVNLGGSEKSPICQFPIGAGTRIEGSTVPAGYAAEDVVAPWSGSARGDWPKAGQSMNGAGDVPSFIRGINRCPSGMVMH